MITLAWTLGALWAIAVALVGWTMSRVVRMGEDLAVIRQQLTPAGETALPVRVDDHERRITVIETRINLKGAVPQ